MYRALSLHAGVLAVAAVLLTACGGDKILPPPAPSVASVQVALASTALMSGMQTKATATVLDSKGVAIAGRTTTWTSQPSGIITVDAQGVVQAVGAGQATVVATVDGIAGRASLSVVAKPDCASAAVTLAVGESRVLEGAQRSSVCVPSGSYTLISLSNSLVPSTRTQVEVAGAGFFSPASSALGALTSNVASAPRFDNARPASRIDYDAHIRRLSDASSMRGPVYSRTSVSSAAAFPPKVGDLFPLYARGSLPQATACTQRQYIGARVAAVGKHIVVVSDTLNPTGGYTNADYQKFADDFDAKVFFVDSAYFATPFFQQQVVVFFTREVNRETPAGATSATVGYFWSGDLASPTNCPTTNGLEMFYVRVPDPNGTINTNKLSKDDAQLGLFGTLAHELQHLINLEQRAIKGVPVEELWLNEGLSNVAEELLFFKLSGLGPKQRITGQTIVQTTAVNDAFNQSLAGQFGNVRAYLASPELNMFFQGASFPVESYGATLQFLRFAMDRTSLDQTTAWRSIEIAPTTGLATIKAVFGDPSLLIRDFAIAQALFDAGTAGAAAQRFLSWDYRDVFLTALRYKQYPLHTQPLANENSVTATLAGGGTAYLTLDVPSGGIASAKITSQGQPVSSGIDLILARTR